jgi:hypothetical protein
MAGRQEFLLFRLKGNSGRTIPGYVVAIDLPEVFVFQGFEGSVSGGQVIPA